jgi:RNA polymerase sigma-70 factor (ECF subfamily)
MQPTPVSLLEQLRDPSAQAAWERFVRLYTPLLCLWAQRLGLRGQEVDDLVQDVFTVLVRRLPSFRYDPQQSFRGWLWTVTVSRFHSRSRPEALLPANGAEVLDVVPDIAEVISEADYRHYITRRALELMEADFEPTSRRAFLGLVLDNRSAADLARELGITENAVYLAKGRILRRLREELAGLLD